MINDKHVVAVFQNKEKAQWAADGLVSRGLNANQVSMLISSEGKGHHFNVSDDKSKTAEGVGYGAVIGGLLAGLTSVAVPGSIFVAGPLAAALAAGAGGAATGGLVGGLIGIGIPDKEVKLVEDDISKGSIVIAVHTVNEKQAEDAKDLFESAGATRIH